MVVITADYQRLVLDDMKNYLGLSHPVQTPLWERLLVRKVSPSKLHPNPEDEFSMSEIGPNFGIVEDYARQIRNYTSRNLPVQIEPLMVEKMSTGGYMILNGHHRWMAAHRVDLKKIPIEIANVIPKEEILKKIRNSEKRMCVSFDLDEVLLTDRRQRPAEREPFFYRWMFRKTLRRNTCDLIRALQLLGFDVWIYTGSASSEKYITKLFRSHNTEVNGIVNCLVKKEQYREIRDTFRRKYPVVLHIDNESVMWVNTGTKEYDFLDIPDPDTAWAPGVMSCIRKIAWLKKEAKHET